MILFNRKRKEGLPAQPLLQTERLVLRAFDANDAVDVYAFGQSETVSRMAGFQRHETLEDSRSMVESFMACGQVWAVVAKRTGHVIGYASLTPDASREAIHARRLAYAFGEEAWGQGYATETCRELLRHAFETLGCDVVSVGLFPFNPKSRRVIKKLGFSFEGVRRHACRLPQGDATDLLCFSLLKSEYEARVPGK